MIFPSGLSQPFAELPPGEMCQDLEPSAAPERGGCRVVRSVNDGSSVNR